MGQMNRLKDKVSLVTGGASGLGKEIARQFLAQGARVFVADLNRELGEKTCSELGAGANFLLLDVTSEQAWKDALQIVIDQAGQLDVLVNNAGIFAFANIEDETLEQWERIHKVNGVGVFLGCKYGLGVMKNHTEAGSIINVSSAGSIRATSSTPAYSSSKALVHNLTWSVALHCGDQGYPVRCNSLHPGAIDTPMLRGQAEGEEAKAIMEKFVAAHPIGRTATVEDIAAAAVFMAADESSFMTGAPIIIDGGNTIR
jgi:3(or 17)beta-hydroxysteroid dehydrogenase